MTYDIGDLYRVFGPAAVDSAFRHVDHGQVDLGPRRTQPDHMFGIVRERNLEAYVSVYVEPDDFGRPDFEGDCSCSKRDCSHVPALLLHALESTTAPGANPSRGNQALQATQTAHATSRWMTELLGAAESHRALQQPAKNKQIVLYIVNQLELGDAELGIHPQFTIERVRVRLLKKGGYSKADRCGYNGRGPIPKYMTALDRRLFAAIGAAAPAYGRSYLSGSEILPEDGPDILERLLATGRCHWRHIAATALLCGEPMPGKIEWVVHNDGTQRPRITVDGLDDAVVLRTHPFWYVSPKLGTCGPLALDLPPAIADALLRAPALEPDAAERVRTKLQGHPALGGFPLPETLAVDETTETVTPVVHLRLHGEDPFDDLAGPGIMPVAELTFRYDNTQVPADQPGKVVQSVHAGKLRRVRRDLEFEARAKRQLERMGFESLDDDGLGGIPEDTPTGQFVPGDVGPDLSSHLYGISVHGVPLLRKAGWVVEIDENYPFRVIEAEHEWYADVAAEEKSDWFDLELGIEIDGKRENLLPILMRLIRDPRFADALDNPQSLQDDGKLLIPLGDRGLIPLSGKRVKAILGTLIELYGDESLGAGDRLELSALNAPRLAELDDAFGEGTLRWAGGERLRELGRKLREFSGVQQVSLPAGFCGSLRPYQQDGLNWLQFLREYGLSGILADDMGLGKTVQVLAHLLVEKNSGRMDHPCLVVAPTSAMANWFREAGRFAPELRVLILQGNARKRHFAKIAEYDLVLTTYPLLTRDAAVLQEQNWHCLILDEAQFVNNARTKSARSATVLRTRHRLCLTGTPMENNLAELWSLFHFLMPGLLGNRRQFGKLFGGPIEKHNDGDRRDQLVSRIRPFMLRRTKDQVALDLPPKTEMVRVVELQRGQRDLYESIRLAMHEKVRAAVAQKGMGRSTIVILDALLKLRQVCCDPRLLKIKQAQQVHERAKLDVLLEMLDELMGEGRRILLFSQFTSMLSLIEPELVARGFDWVKITGSTTDRDTPVQRFQNGEVPLFLISLKAGGTALNLTAADTVIHYDPWWNPAVEAQATDRAHRIGQDKPVFVYKLIAASSVEEKMVAMQERKRKLADGIYGADGKLGQGFTDADLESLFQPLA